MLLLLLLFQIAAGFEASPNYDALSSAATDAAQKSGADTTNIQVEMSVRRTPAGLAAG